VVEHTGADDVVEPLAELVDAFDRQAVDLQVGSAGRAASASRSATGGG
jgi:hypothetical protein